MQEHVWPCKISFARAKSRLAVQKIVCPCKILFGRAKFSWAVHFLFVRAKFCRAVQKNPWLCKKCVVVQNKSQTGRQNVRPSQKIWATYCIWSLGCSTPLRALQKNLWMCKKRAPCKKYPARDPKQLFGLGPGPEHWALGPGPRPCAWALGPSPVPWAWAWAPGLGPRPCALGPGPSTLKTLKKKPYVF